MSVAGQQVPPFPAPQDQELKNIIDKLANFVARNGSKFEEMTKSKQKDNPKFSFLFGGDYFNYYKWRVSVEIAQCKLLPQHLQSQPYQNTQASLVQHVQQSIQSAPWQQAQQVQQPQVISDHQAPQQQPYHFPTNNVNIPEFESFLVKIMQSCTKEHISNGKNWIFKNCKTEGHFKQVADYLLLRVTGAGMGFLHKLHIIYLINDVLHNASRKTTLNVESQLQKIIVPIYCHTHIGETQENQQRCEKVVRIWETNEYFNSATLEKLKNPMQSDKELNASQGQDEEARPVIERPMEKINQQTEEGNTSANKISESEDIPMSETQISDSNQSQPNTLTMQPLPSQSEHPPSEPVFPPDPNFPFPPPNFHQFPPPGFPRPPFNRPPPGFNGQPMPPFDPNFPRPPHIFPPIPPQRFDYNHGFGDQGPGVPEFHHAQGGAPVVEQQLPQPQAMYYELPAGLMVPLINSPDVDYEPLDPKDIRLPPPQPPSDRLLTAVEAFYSPPSHERPRNSDGWEAGALHEFYKTKLKFIKEREIRDKVEMVKEMAQKLKKQDEKEEEEEKQRPRSLSKSPPKAKSPSPVRRRSRSSSPARRKSRSRSRSKSPRRRRQPSRSRSRSAQKSRSRSGSRSRSRSRSPRRRRSRSPRRRSPTPPSFGGPFLQKSLNTRIDESNVGHQLLKKMGWEGAGLGKSEQGIQDPIKQGEVRDKQDMFKGIGVDINDPFDQYRKNMSYTYNRPRRDRDRR
ncbi:calcium homeostasis endoplasmic reticulum protein-like isoform X2 [Xenia sp. Carnegie-2017]|uniref:calcium homeostasis endoplasmic reticulum protein-like isoform X2 n=1 Tax=Xenia sp. Carnegie-2017 TaxID=2897299 RepID=UPI001F03B696|nr:calcium homeostasis endoplasmic reticulum protein-like isoform X2 [Xenia sp. Carnegie-2017]